MTSSAAPHRGVVTALCADRVADRTIVTGLQHDYESARVAALLREAGLQADVHIDTDHRSLAALAHGVGARGADVVIARATDPLPDGLLSAWLALLRRECPRARLVCLHDGCPPREGAAADLAFAAGDDRRLLAALGASEDAADTAGPAARVSPYLSRIVPANAAARVGIDVRGAHGSRPAALVADEVRLLDRRASGEPHVVLRGLAGHLEDPEARELLRLLARSPRRRVRLLAEAAPDALDEAVIGRLLEAGVGVRLVVRTDHAAAAERLDGLLDPFIAAGVGVELHLVVAAGDDIQRLAAAARALAPGFTYEIAPGPVDADELLELVRELAPESGTTPRLAELEQEAALRLQQLLCGGREDPRSSGGADALLWLDGEPDPGQAEWVAATASLRAGIWSTAQLGGRGWACEGDPGAGAAVCLYGHERELEVIPYAAGRNAIPYGPLVLGLTDAEDVRALLYDADEARRSGTFPAALAHPFTAVGDGVAFAGPASGAGTVGRLIVQDGEVRTGLAALALGRVGDSAETLAQRAAAAQREREARRGCERCPIASACSRDGSLERLLDDDAYCSMRRARPWLGLYVALPSLVRQVLRADSELAARADRVELRISGFGGPLYYPHDPDDEGPSSPLAVIEAHGRHFLADAVSGRCARLTADLAVIVDGLLASASAADTGAWLACERGLDAEQARGAVEQALALLDGAGIGAGVRALLTAGATAVTA